MAKSSFGSIVGWVLMTWLLMISIPFP
jgi:hypothetical protein